MNFREYLDNSHDLNRVHECLDKNDTKSTLKEQPLPKIESSPSMHVSSDTISDNLANSEKSTKLAQIEQSPKCINTEKVKVEPNSCKKEAQDSKARAQKPINNEAEVVSTSIVHTKES